uniref:Uncharacterized protein n=1 Tax=Romanomermis culicivorax TaxID=13658 RepID=A0A915L1C6_ROMCU
PNFDGENPFDGPKIDDEKCFKKLTNFSQSDRQVWLVHSKVLRWITVAKSKLAEKSINYDDDVCSPRYSDICSEFGCKKGESSQPGVVFPVTEEPTILEKMAKQEASEDLEDTVIR